MVEEKKSKKKQKRRAHTKNEIPVSNSYDRFNLDFLETNADNRIMNGEFDVTDTSERLYGCPTGGEEIHLRDYMVLRPVPQELIKWRNIPSIDGDSMDMENWYQELIDYCVDGVWVDGEFWNPFMVYWLNVFVFPVYKLDDDGEFLEDFDPGHPFYCNIDRYILDVAWKAEITRQDVSLMGGRGVGKSYLWGAIMDREWRLFPGSWTVVSSTNDETTSEAWNKIEECITSVEKKHRALKHKRIADSASMKWSGEIIELPDGTTEKRGYLSKFEKITYGKNAGKTRGKRPTKQLVEEFAAFPPSTQKGSLRACMRESKGSWLVGGAIKKCTVLYSGTGGTVENDEAEDIFCKPSAHSIIPTYDWEEAGKDGCGIFIPTHIKRSGTWETTGCSDIKKATELVQEERDAAFDDPQSYMGLLQEFPMTIKEVFMRSGVNIFNAEKISQQRVTIKKNDNIPVPERGFLNWTRNAAGKISGITWDSTPYGDIEILEHPHWLTEASNAEEKEPMPGLYVVGVDSIDQGNRDSSFATNNKDGSELAALVKKRIVDKGYMRATSNLYVAKYNKRSDNVRDDHDNALKLSYYYNAKVNLEYTKVGIVSHFRNEGFYGMLSKRPTINLGTADPKKTSHLIGTTTGSSIINHQDELIAEYINENYKEIWFPDILEQLQDYDRDNRTKFDMVIAMGLCELADEDLMGKAAKPAPNITAGLKKIGFYTEIMPDGRRIKRRGVIPDQNKSKEMDDFIERQRQGEAKKFQESGGVRWTDASEPTGNKFIY